MTPEIVEVVDTETVSLRKAAALAGVSHETVRTWCGKYGFGRQDAKGRWFIPIAELMQVSRAHAKAKALIAELIANLLRPAA